jgi:hypothetical protein
MSVSFVISWAGSLPSSAREKTWTETHGVLHFPGAGVAPIQLPPLVPSGFDYPRLRQLVRLATEALEFGYTLRPIDVENP